MLAFAVSDDKPTPSDDDEGERMPTHAGLAPTGRIALVTGASRGAGRGIARALGAAGMTVYVTGRTVDDGSAALPGTVPGTAREVDAAGGRGIAVACDHDDDRQVAALVERIADEQGCLDVLVNNAYAVPAGLTDDRPFWEQPLDFDMQFRIGLRSTYVMSALAAPLMIRHPERHGLIVNTSGFGGGCYMHGPAYGAVKAGVDKMAHDMAVDLGSHGVAAVSLWMGLLRTERTERVLAADPDRYRGVDRSIESAEFPGRVIAALDASGRALSMTGRVLVAAELAAELGVVDVDGRVPHSRRRVLGDPPVFAAAVVR